jgi:hypothetical protein
MHINHVKKKDLLIIAILIFLILLIISQSNKTKIPEIIDETSNEFSNEQIVNIIGYDDDAMESHISRDGKYLFFNNQDGPTNKDLYYATKINDTTFNFKGEVLGVNTDAVEGTPSLVTGNKLYFVSTRDFEQGTIYSGIFKEGKIENLEKISGSINIKKIGWLNMDVWVSPDGKNMYTSHANFLKGVPPSDSNIRYAIKEGEEFNIPENEQNLFVNINTDYALEYAPELSDDGLEMFYTQLTMSKPMLVKLYLAKRQNINDPFKSPELIQEAYIKDESSFFEAPTISSDGKLLYYHKMQNGKFSIFVLSGT